MPDSDHHSPGFSMLVGRLARTALGAMRSRFELFAVEWQEERIRAIHALGWGLALVVAGILSALCFTALIIFLFPEDLRVYVLAGFTILYGLGAASAGYALRSALKPEPFSETMDQVRKDRTWLESLN
jgi:uncharacterized membrane protein YqjE